MRSMQRKNVSDVKTRNYTVKLFEISVYSERKTDSKLVTYSFWFKTQTAKRQLGKGSEEEKSTKICNRFQNREKL